MRERERGAERDRERQRQRDRETDREREIDRDGFKCQEQRRNRNRKKDETIDREREACLLFNDNIFDVEKQTRYTLSISMIRNRYYEHDTCFLGS